MAEPTDAHSRIVPTLDQLLDLRTPDDPQIAPDGASVAFVVAQWVAGEPKQRRRIWQVATSGGDPRPLTAGSQGDGCPRWSPDGTHLAFISQRDAADVGAAQLYVLAVERADNHSPAQGDALPTPRRVCVLPGGVSDLAWSPDGSRIALLARDGADDHSEPSVNEPTRHQRLWTVRPGSDLAEPITPPELTVWSYAWSPDSSMLAVFYSTGPGETDWYRGQIGIVAGSGGAVRTVTKLSRQAGGFTWSRDGRRLYFISGEWSDRPLLGGDVYVLDVERGTESEPRNLTPDAQINYSWVRETPDGRLLYAAWQGTSSEVGILDSATGAAQPLLFNTYIGDRAYPHLSATSDLRTVVGTSTTASHPLEVFAGDIDLTLGSERSTWRRLTRLNPIAEETWRTAPIEQISYESVDGWSIDALYTPPLPGTTSDSALPALVVNVHGGPSSAWRAGWPDAQAQLLAAAGYAVLRPNIRGSLGRGVAFADAVLGDMGGKDLQDVLRGVDYLVERGLVDGKRVAIIGGSYGGFMAAWAVTQTSRFRASVMVAGICDFHSFHAQTNITDWDMRFLAAHPLRQPQVYRERSAITHATRVTTPTLIIHGERDLCVPVNQAYAFYRALRELQIPTELAVYPREGHGLSEHDHVRDYNERVLRWFARHL